MASSLLGTGFFQPQARPGGVTVATESLAAEIAPFMKDYLERESALATLRSEGLRDEETGELVLDPETGEPVDPGGYKAFTGQTIADFTPEQLAAQRGLAGLAGFDITTDPETGERSVTQTGTGLAGTRFADAEALIRGQQEEFTGDVAQRFMSPFQQAVIDIEKREAQQKFEQDVLPKVQAAAIQSGSFGGSRGALLEAEALRGQQQLLGDIQAKGLQSAFTQGRQAFEQQKARERGQAQALIGLSPAQIAQRTRELQGLERVGAAQQAQTQTALDEAYQQFLEEQAFPESVLDRMQSAAFGFPALRQQVTQRPTTFGPSPFATLASGIGAVGTGIGSLFGQLGGRTATGRKRGGIVSRRDGGLVPLVRRAVSGRLPKEIAEGGNTSPLSDALFNRRQQEEIANKAIEEMIRQRKAISEERKGLLRDKAQPMKILLASLMEADKIPQGVDARNLPLGFNLKGVAQKASSIRDDLEDKYRTIEEREQDQKLADMQRDITRGLERADRRVQEEQIKQQYNLKEREATREDTKVIDDKAYKEAYLALQEAQTEAEKQIAKDRLAFESKKLASQKANQDRTYQQNERKLKNAIESTNIAQRKVIQTLLLDEDFTSALVTGETPYAIQQMEKAGISKDDAIEIIAAGIISHQVTKDIITPDVNTGKIKPDDLTKARQAAKTQVSDFYGATE